jgi:hypothetical protein
MKRWLSRQIDGLIDRLAERVARKTVQQYFFVELHPSTILLREAQAEAAEYVRQRMPRALYFVERESLLRYALDQVTVDGQVLEFGVFAGKTIRTIASRVAQPVHGFDTFQGLPEDWAGSKSPKGDFSLGGRLPQVPANVTLHQGLFEATLPGFVSAHPQPLAFAHVDCDLYSSTRTVLEHVGPLVVPGSVLLFDDYFNYPGWKEGEHKAFREWVEARKVRYRYVGYARHQAAVVIESVG